MTSEQFCYWLQGMMEIENPENLSKEQLKIIKDHLQLVFNKITPNYTKETFPTNPLEIHPWTDPIYPKIIC